MMMEQGRNPEAFLEVVRADGRGKLTVFLGACAGVGKTYAMLEAAQKKLSEGVDIVVGLVETHGRTETQQLLSGLPKIELASIEYNGKQLQELNLEAILQRRPQIVLVDELAHSNVPGSRFVRRYQDVEEILLGGIDVYTTVNIQHMESLNDIVAQVTGVVVKETVPDYVVEQANAIKLVDIPVDDLLKRLQEGKVYIPQQATQALNKFFRKGNLNSLREMSLRFTAMQVEHNKKRYMDTHRIAGPWPTTGRVMVCVSSSPFSAQLIRAAKRLADGLQGDFLAINVREANSTMNMDENAVERLNRNMRLAEELGGKTYTIVGDDLVTEIINIAKTHNVTSIVVGKSGRSFFWNLVHGSLVDKLIRYSTGMNVYVIQGRTEQGAFTGTFSGQSANIEMHTSVRQMLASTIMVAVVTAFCWLFQVELKVINIPLIYLLPVLFAATWWGRKPSYLTAFLGMLCFDFFFVPPLYSLNISDIHHVLSFFVFFIVSFVIGGRTEVLRKEAREAKQREVAIRSVHDFSRTIVDKIEDNIIVQELAKRCAETLQAQVVVLLPDEQNKLQVMDGEGGQGLPDSDYAVALWSYEHKQLAGFDTQVLPGSPYRFVPLVASEQAYGVIGICTNRKKISPEHMMFLNAWAGLAALALERIRLTDSNKREELFAEAESLRKVIFNSVSHELKTPLAAIKGATSGLADARISSTESVRNELVQTIQEGALRMERIVNNLLDNSRFETRNTVLQVEWCDLQDVLGVVLRELREQTSKYKLEICLPAELPFIRADAKLLEHVFSNLLDNATKYSPLESTIKIEISLVNEEKIVCSVSDQGFGIAETERELVFDKFFRGKQNGSVGGSGLGLSICKNIINAHQGEIWVDNILGNGTKISFSLPLNMDGAKQYNIDEM